MTSQLGKGLRFRELHRSGTFVLPNPADRGTARLLQQAGFEALATSSAGLAFSLGVPDGAVPREVTIRHLADLCSSTSLPVSADLGNGFGREPGIVAETILMAAEAGVVGASIEDWTGDPQNPLFELGLARERISAAVEAARSLPVPFMLTARAENYLVGRPHLDDVVRRLDAYRMVGADVLYAPCLPDEAAIREILGVAQSTPVNVLALPAGPSSSLALLGCLGVRRVSLGSALPRTAITAVRRAIASLGSGSFEAFAGADGLTQLNEIFSARSALEK